VSLPSTSSLGVGQLFSDEIILDVEDISSADMSLFPFHIHPVIIPGHNAPEAMPKISSISIWALGDSWKKAEMNIYIQLNFWQLPKKMQIIYIPSSA
jgi:hypothetical protein